MYKWSIFAFVTILAATLAASCGGGGGGTKLIFPTGTGTGTGTGTDTGTVDQVNFEDYFWPLDEDWRWTFDDGEYQEIRPAVTVGTETTYPMAVVSDGLKGYTWYFYSDGSGTLLQARFGIYPELYWDFDNSLVWGKRQMVKDETITTEATGTEYDFVTEVPTGNTDSWKFEATYLGKEAVSVPAGDFPNCIKVNYKTYRDSSLYFEETYWFSWGSVRTDGIVKNHVTNIEGTGIDLWLEVSSIQYPP
jgi:hypothetical protein